MLFRHFPRPDISLPAAATFFRLYFRPFSCSLSIAIRIFHLPPAAISPLPFILSRHIFAMIFHFTFISPFHYVLRYSSSEEPSFRQAFERHVILRLLFFMRSDTATSIAPFDILMPIR